jgi:hypothetical protein
LLIVNKKQKIVLWIGIFIFVLLCLGAVRVEKPLSFEYSTSREWLFFSFTADIFDGVFGFARISLSVLSVVIAGIFTLKTP